MEIEKSRVLSDKFHKFWWIVIFQGLFQKSQQEGPNYQMDSRNSTVKDTLEDTRRYEKVVGESGTPEAFGGG
jgi:hypothetical protein